MIQNCYSLNISKIQLLLKSERDKSDENLVKPYKNDLKNAAILIPLVCVDGRWSLLFTRRADSLKNHRGQVSFPGGGKEAQDSTLIDTALREANEEIGLKESGIHIIGLMPDFVTNSDYLVTPVVSWVDWPFPLEISKDEVSRVFTIPIKFLENKNNY
jgi:8-oxo-dGTP pyrophosphatase MutT (NUDIX family)